MTVDETFLRELEAAAGSPNEQIRLLAKKITALEVADVSLESEISGAGGSGPVRSENFVFGTGTATPINGAVIDLSSSPFTDTGGNTYGGYPAVVGDVILFNIGIGTPHLLKISVKVGDLITVTDVGVTQLANGDLFLIKNFLADDPATDGNKNEAWCRYDDGDVTKLGDADWEARFANNQLSNLSATAVGADLIFDTGTETHVYTKNNNAASTQAMNLHSGDAGGSGNNSGGVSIFTGVNDTDGGTGAISIFTGTGAPGVATGGIDMHTGNVDGPTGTVNIASGSSDSDTTGDVNIATGVTEGAVVSGAVLCETGSAVTAGGSSGNIEVHSGDAALNSGSITVSVGSAGGTRGKIKFVDGSEGNVGDVWTETAGTGAGSWVTPTPSGKAALAAIDLVSTTPLTLTGEQVIDGILTSLSRVLVTFQNSDAADPTNGVYLTGPGAWSRVSDMNSSSEFYSGMTFKVRSGTTWAKSNWFLDTAAPITLGVTGLTFYPENISKGSTGVATGGFRITNGPSSFAAGQAKQLIIDISLAAANSIATLKLSTSSATGNILLPSIGATDPNPELLSAKNTVTGITDKRFDTTAANPNRAFSWYFPDPETFGAGFGGDPGADGAWNALFYTSFYPSFRKGNNQATNHFAERHLAVATVAKTNISLTGEQTINGVLTSGSRVLLTGQTAPAENGLWKTAAGAWQRPGNGFDASSVDADGNISASYFPGLQIYVNGGTYANTLWTLTTTAAITLGTTGLTFVRVNEITHYDSNASSGGSGTETLTVTGLASTDEILSVSQKAAGGSATAMIGWANQTTNALDVTWTANPGAGAIIRVAVRKA